MGGHLNMMDDVLISSLTPELLRSSLRAVVSQGSTVQKPFLTHIQQRLTECPPPLTSPQDLFPAEDILTTEAEQYLRSTRSIFSSKLPEMALKYLTHFIDALRLGNATWTPSSALGETLAKFGGDIVQAVQALKETRPEPTAVLERRLLDLNNALNKCRVYSRTRSLDYPFVRPERQLKDVIKLLYPGMYLADEEMEPKALDLVLNQEKARLLEKTTIGPFEVPRLFNGFWQLSSPAWGSGTAENQEAALARLVESGLVAADMADHYGDAELVYGDFRAKLTLPLRDQIYAATKWCIFSPPNQAVTHQWVLDAVQERCRRLRGRVELLQLHWYDYEVKNYLEVLRHLVDTADTCPDLVSSIGLCNCDSEHVEEACEYLLARTGKVGLVSNQIQFSLLDSRPLQKMCATCTKYGLKLLTYGSLCGGFLSEKWLGQPLPEAYSQSTQLTPSQRKARYFDMIQNWGSWSDFQKLLDTLSTVAKNHQVSLTNVATRWVLQQDAVGAVLVGTRLGMSSHEKDNLAVFSFQLDDDELKAINDFALGIDGAKSKALFDKLGDCGKEYQAMH